jgi:hypothetical protein
VWSSFSVEFITSLKQLRQLILVLNFSPEFLIFFSLVSSVRLKNATNAVWLIFTSHLCSKMLFYGFFCLTSIMTS